MMRYGREVSPHQILNGAVPKPVECSEFYRLLNLKFGDMGTAAGNNQETTANFLHGSSFLPAGYRISPSLELYGLTMAQLEIILSLVSIAENSDTDWRKQFNYIEDINDNRGYTISIVGFCTGTGDFIQVLETLEKFKPDHHLVKFIPLVRGKKDGDISGLEDLPRAIKSVRIDDWEFHRAVWEIISKLYWTPANKFAHRVNIRSPLGIYIIYDTILNLGTLDSFESLKYNLNTLDPYAERTNLECFLAVKRQEISSGNFGDTVDNRVDMQYQLLRDSKFLLEPPLCVQCYGDTFNL